MLIGIFIELLVTIMVLSALLITCAVLLDAGPRNKPPGAEDAQDHDLPLPFVR